MCHGSLLPAIIQICSSWYKCQFYSKAPQRHKILSHIETHCSSGPWHY